MNDTMKLSDAKDQLGLEEEKLRKICEEYDISIVQDEKGNDSVEITPLLRLAAELEKSKFQADNNWALLKSSLNRVEAANDVAGATPNAKASNTKWTDKLGALAAVVAAAAAIWAVCIARNEFTRAIDAFKLGNQYQYQNDFISAYEDLQNEQPAAIIISLNERFRLGKQIEGGNGFPENFWEDYTTNACDSLTASQCTPAPGLDAEPTVYKNRFKGYDAILEICYAEHEDNENLCTPKED